MTSPSLDHDVRRTASFDGTLLAIRPLGAAPAIPHLVVPAIGVDLSIWRNVLRRTLEVRHAIAWDLRGMHESEAPRSGRIDAAAHAEDAVAVLNEVAVERAHLLAWSSGTRIALEIAHRYPERVASIALVCGGYGIPTKKLLRRLDLAGLMPLAAGVAKHFPGVVGGLLSNITARADFAGLVRQSGFLGPTADVAAAVEVLKSIASCDMRRMLAMFEAVSGDAAPEVLPAVRAPALIVAGERDSFTPLSLIKDVAAALPGARLNVYEGGSHFVPLEFPARLADCLLYTSPSPRD